MGVSQLFWAMTNIKDINDKEYKENSISIYYNGRVVLKNTN